MLGVPAIDNLVPCSGTPLIFAFCIFTGKPSFQYLILISASEFSLLFYSSLSLFSTPVKCSSLLVSIHYLFLQCPKAKVSDGAFIPLCSHSSSVQFLQLDVIFLPIPFLPVILRGYHYQPPPLTLMSEAKGSRRP
ncbi:hypothetical protein VNO77_20427 [Canavalia gladiata]|uniref:Uncharacterized protein n=1 Tax=Canavalia gladiata TaxID=3824 RepID=A0AAN9LP74_CANGL